MSTVNVVCPSCQKINRIPKRDSYKKVNCGHCKQSMLNAKPVNVDQNSFPQFVYGSDLPVVVDFWAPWCGPCKMMAPAFEEASKSLSLQAQFIKVNTQEQEQLGAQHAIRSIPTMVMFKNGKEIDRISGAMSSEQIKQWVNSKNRV